MLMKQYHVNPVNGEPQSCGKPVGECYYGEHVSYLPGQEDEARKKIEAIFADIILDVHPLLPKPLKKVDVRRGKRK